jgi:translation initiation factor IF-2
MAKVRVGQLAKELGLKVADVLSLLRKLGIEAKTNLSVVGEEDAAKARSGLTQAAPAVAEPGLKATTKAPPPARPRTAVPPARPVTAARPAAETRPVATAPKGGAIGARPLATPAASSPARSIVQTARKPVPAQAGPAVPARSPAASPLPPRPGATPAAGPVRPVPGAVRPPAPGASPPAGQQAVRPGAPRVAPPLTGAARSGPAAAVPRPGMPAAQSPRPVTPSSLKPAASASPAPVIRRPVPPGAPPRPLVASRPAAVVPGPRPAPPAGLRGPVPARPAAPVPARQASSARPSPRPEPAPRPGPPPPPPVPEVLKEITITEGVTVKELSEKMDRKAKDIITRLIARGILATINQPLDTRVAQEVCRELGFDAKVISFEEEVAREEATESSPADLRARNPVVTIMGHVDHGKTSLLDAIRASNIVAGEAGGITQHIGAYHIQHKGRGVTFIDTPGHEAFTMMRARGARVTDVVVLVVAADDGVMPQTVEAIDHARAAGVPIVVALNKVDKPEANLDRVKKQLSDHGLLVEDWGGQVVSVPISAKKKTGITELLEMIQLVTDIQDLKADPSTLASGTVLESRLDKARGPVASVLVQRGTLRVGDPFIAGAIHGKVRAMFDDLGHRLKEAGPSLPAEVLGLEGVPKAGDPFQVLEEEWKVRQIGAFRQQKQRQEAMAKSSRLTLDHLYQQIKEGTVKELPIVVKADVQGSVEALTKTLGDLPSDRVKIRTIHAGTGAITESDVLLASASNAVIIGFNVRPERGAQELAEKEKVDLRLHTIIYDVTNEIRNAMVGLLEPETKETYLGRAEVRQLFKVPKAGTIAGCLVADGRIARTAEVRLLRDNVVIHTGKIGSLRRFKDDVSEVKSGYECGIGIANYNDLKIGDVIEAFKLEKVAVKSL